MAETVELRKSVPVVEDVDVLVVGAGIAGATAAVTAAREGAKTMVVDRFGYPGGNMGPGMIGGAPSFELPPAMKDGMPGVPGEFLRRSEAHAGGPLLANYFRDSQIFACVWLRMMEESGVWLMLNSYAGDPIMDGDRVAGLFVENKTGTQAVRAKVVVDATGDADVATRAGAPTDGGKSYFHAGVYFAMNNVDVDRYRSEVFSGPPSEDDVKWASKLGPGVASRTRNLGPFFRYFRAAWEAGDYKFVQDIDGLGRVCCDHGIFHSVAGVQDSADPLRIGKYGIIGALVGIWRDEDPTSGDTRVMTAIEVKSRTFIFETARFLTRYVPGFERAYLLMIAPYFHSRGGRSIVSERPVTKEDVAAERKLDDVVFQAIHGPVRSKEAEGRIEHFTEVRCSYDFPYRQLLPQKVDGLLVTGRACIIQPPNLRPRWMVLLMGQAAGAAAALAARTGKHPRHVDVRELQRILHCKYQAPLGDEARLRELGLLTPGS